MVYTFDNNTIADISRHLGKVFFIISGNDNSLDVTALGSKQFSP